jgi:hypothetical protein
MIEYGMDTYNNDDAYARGELVMIVPTVIHPAAIDGYPDENFLAVILAPHLTAHLAVARGTFGTYRGKMYDVYAPSLSRHVASAYAHAVHSIHTKFIKKL